MGKDVWNYGAHSTAARCKARLNGRAEQHEIGGGSRPRATEQIPHLAVAVAVAVVITAAEDWYSMCAWVGERERARLLNRMPTREYSKYYCAVR